MARTATLTDSIGVGSLSVGIQDVAAQDRRAIFQIVGSGPFALDFYATQDFNFSTGVGSNWTKVTDRAKSKSGDDDHDFFTVFTSFVRKKPGSGVGLPITEPGVYAFDDGFMPAGFNVTVTSVTSGSPLKILFGV